MTKLKIAENPTFTTDVEIPRVSGDPIKVPFTFRYRNRAELAELFALAPAESPLSTSGGMRAPTLRFFSGSEGKQGGQLTVQTILQQIGSVQVGTPYVLAPDMRCFPAQGIALLAIGAPFQYWIASDSSNRRLACWLRPQARRAEYQGEKVTECVIALHLLLPGAQPLHPDLAPGQVVLSTWKSACSAPPVQLYRAVEQTTSAQWAQANPQLAGLPPAVRVFGALATGVKTSAIGYQYVTASAICLPVGVAQIAALGAWKQDAAAQEELAEARAAFADEIAEIRGSALDAPGA